MCVMHRARAELAKIFSRIISTRRAAGSTENDMLQVTPLAACPWWLPEMTVYYSCMAHALS